MCTAVCDPVSGRDPCEGASGPFRSWRRFITSRPEARSLKPAAARSGLAFLLGALPLLAQSGDEILSKVDKIRHPWPSYAVDVSIQGGSVSQRWRVFARENRDARVEGLSEKEKGRVVLLLGEKMWLLLPKAKKPVQVTPSQRLLGPAAGGDIARSYFAEDYEVIQKSEASLEGTSCWRMELQARRPSLSFRKVHLWVEFKPLRPIKAEYFLASGKLSKVALFPAPVALHGLMVLPGMNLAEPGGRKVELRFENWIPGTHDPGLFQLAAPK